MEGYFMAQVMLFAGNFAPRNWAFCEGQLMAIAQNEALFALIGTTYGGDGRTTFALPDLRGRTPVGTGQGPGLSDFSPGQAGGANSATLTTNNLAPHTHGVSVQIAASTGNGTVNTPDQNVPANTSGPVYAAAAGATGQLAGVSGSAMPSGSNQPVNLVQPYLAMHFVICLYGIFPSRN